MKVIKHLKKESPQYRLKAFFKQMPFFTRILLILIFTMSIVLEIFNQPIQFSWYSIIDSRPIIQMIFFMMISLTDFQMEERKGSIYFICGFLCKSGFLIFLRQGTELIFKSFITIQPITSYPLLFIITLGFQEMIIHPHQKRYFLIDPFQIKKLFYPIFIIIGLQLISLRIDIFYSFILGIILYFIKFDTGIMFLSRKIDQKFICDRLVRCGFHKTGCPQIQMGQIDRVATNNSVVLQE